MGKIDLTINKEGLAHNIKKAKENGIIIPTIAEMQHPETIPEKIQEKLKSVGMWDVNPLNLFRITWKNQPKVEGALFQAVPNYVEIPSAMNTTFVETSRANAISWVTTIIVRPSFARLRMTSSTSPTICGSSALVGSSKSRTSGSIASARAIATRCFWPPESWEGLALM